MKVLTLSIKREWFDKILAGEKGHEYREIRPNNSKRYVKYVHKGKEYDLDTYDQIPVDDEEPKIVCRKYDAIKFLTGAYSGKRPWALVEVKDANVDLFVDDDNEYICYEWTDGKEYVMSQIDYTLGKVLDKNLNPE
jgi:hypothetical protein